EELVGGGVHLAADAGHGDGADEVGLVELVGDGGVGGGRLPSLVGGRGAVEAAGGGGAVQAEGAALEHEGRGGGDGGVLGVAVEEGLVEVAVADVLEEVG